MYAACIHNLRYLRVVATALFLHHILWCSQVDAETLSPAKDFEASIYGLYSKRVGIFSCICKRNMRKSLDWTCKRMVFRCFKKIFWSWPK